MYTNSPFPIRLGAIQKVIDRAAEAIVPHDEAIAQVARQATGGGYIDKTPWPGQHRLPWRWTMLTDTVSLSLMPPHCSKEALCERIADWAGILVSEGYGVSQPWGHRRHTCVAPLIRTARGMSDRRDPERAACGSWALKELQRVCQLAQAPPTGGAWQAWYARLGTVISRYRACKDDAGRLTRRVQREMASLWGFLVEYGVEPTNNRAERSLRCGVLWRKRSGGTARDKGNHWVERILSLRQTCRQRSRSSFGVLVDAISRWFHGRQPALSWLS